jgi:hypothetical protein
MDFEDMMEPWWVSGRAQQLHNLPHTYYEFGSIYSLPEDEEAPYTRSVTFLRNRWPRCETKHAGWNGVTQWLVNDGVVIAQDTIRNTGDADINFTFGFFANLLIRELDFDNSQYTFNEEGDANTPDGNYARGEGPNGYTFLKVHKFSTEKSAGAEGGAGRSDPKIDTSQKDPDAEPAQPSAAHRPDAVGVVLGIFIDGKSQKWKEFENGKDIVVKAKTTLEFTVGHKLVLLSSDKVDWKPLVLTAEQVDVDRILGESSSPYFKDDGLDYATRRNVEHILSVCTMPVSPTPVWDYSPIGDDSTASKEDAMVAFTCGDMAGHRVFPSAS